MGKNFTKYFLTANGFSFLLILLFSFSFVSKKEPPEIIWKKDFKLSWKNFKGKPDPKNSFYANTNSGMSFEKWADEDTAYFKVTAVFYTHKSWVRKEKTLTDTLLRHEQLHFDITELFARKFRERLSKLSDKKNNHNSEFEMLRTEIFKELDAYQDEYDKETDHCMITSEQEKWSKKISKELIQLEKYSGVDVKIRLRK